MWKCPGLGTQGQHRVKYGRTPKPQWATALLNQGFLYICLAHLLAILEMTTRTPMVVSNISVCQLIGSDKGPKHCGDLKQFCGYLGPLPDFTSSQKTKGRTWCFFLLRGSQWLFSFSVSATTGYWQTVMLWQLLNTRGEKDIYIWGSWLLGGKELPAKVWSQKEVLSEVVWGQAEETKP